MIVLLRRCSFARAVLAAGEQEQVHVVLGDGPEQPPVAVPKPALQGRSSVMFSGATGAVVASGEGAATSAPSNQLVEDVIKLIEALPPELFDGTLPTKQRPCGLLDTYDAVGMLICDVLGLPPVPWTLAKKIGRAAVKLPPKFSSEVKAAKKRAARAGADESKAAADVLRRVARLPIPSTAEIAEAWRELENAAQPPAALERSAPESSAPASAQASAPELAPASVPASVPASDTAAASHPLASVSAAAISIPPSPAVASSSSAIVRRPAWSISYTADSSEPTPPDVRRLLHRWDNLACSCAELAGDRSFPRRAENGIDVDHHFLCQVYKCYAFEIGCCDPDIRYRGPDSESKGFPRDACNLPCECLRPAFGMFGEAYMGPVPNERYMPGLNEDLWWAQPREDWTGRHLKACPGGGDCPGWCRCMGRYVPTCPSRRHAITGEMRGDQVAAMRGHKIPFQDICFGEDLP